MNHEPLFRMTPSGLYCPAGEFFVDPHRPVSRAVITHAHGDHARRGSRQYLTARPGLQVLATRMGDSAPIETLEYGATAALNGVKVSFHPAGHILGSAQVRAEFRGEIWVISGDYRITADATCAAFEPVRCHTFVTESTFGLPIFHWPPQAEVFAQINSWWKENQAAGRASLVYAYALGKAQRILAGIDPSIGPIFTHAAVETCNRDYRASGVALPLTTAVGDAPIRNNWSRALILAPPAARTVTWKRKFGPCSSAFASGWMCVRGALQRRGVDRGFVLSDHADWPELLQAIEATGAQRVLVMHGYIAALVRWLRQQGLEADPLNPELAEDAGDLDEMPELEPVPNAVDAIPNGKARGI